MLATEVETRTSTVHLNGFMECNLVVSLWKAKKKALHFYPCVFPEAPTRL